MATNTDILVTIRGRDAGASEAINGVANSMDKANSSFADGMKRAGVIATGVLAGIVVAGSKMLDVASNIEQARVAFETMTGSAKIAGDLMQQISDFAIKTPFELPGVIQAARQLMAMGSSVQDVLPNLKMLGDLAAGTGAPLERLVINFGQVQLQGKLTGRELRDFAMNGVGLLDQLASQMGKTTAEIMDMVSSGAIGFDEVKKAFQNMTTGTGKFADLMEKQAHTFGGVMSNIRDQITRTSASIMGIDVKGNIREGSIFAVAKKGAEELLAIMDKLAPTLTRVADAIGKNQVAVFAILGGLIGLVTVAFVGFLAMLAGGIVPLLLFVGVGAMLGAWFALFKKSIEDAKKSIDQFWIPALTTARDWVVNKFTEIVAWFNTLKEQVTTTITGLAEAISTGFNNAVTAIVTFFTVTIPNAFNTFVTAVGNAITSVVTFITGLPEQLASAFVVFVTQTIPFVLGVLVGFITVGLPGLLGQLVGFLIQTGINIVTEVSTWPARFQAWVQMMIDQAILAITNFGIAAGLWIVTTGAAIIAEVSTWPSRFMAWITALVTQVIASITKWATDMIAKITATGTSAVNEVATWPGRIMAWINTIPGLVKTALDNLWNTFTTALNNIWNTIVGWKDKVVGAFEAVRNAINSAIDAASRAFQKGVKVGSLGFQTGGIVPGPLGMPQLATVHGGEEILPVGRTDAGMPTGGGGASVVFEVHVGLYAGTETEKRNIARDLYAALLQVAQSQNKSVSQLMGG